MTGRTRKRIALLLAAIVVLGSAAVGLQALRSFRLAGSLELALREGTAAYEAGDHETAMRHLSFYVARRREPGAVLMLADCRRHVPQENRRHLPAAITFAREAVALDPLSIAAHELLLDLYHEAGFATEAVSTADALLVLAPGHRRAREARMVADARLGRLEDAIATAVELAEDDPGDVEAHRRVAQFMQLGERPGAEIREYLEGVADRAADDFGFALLHAEAAILTGDATEALSRARRASGLPIRDGDQLAQLLRLLDTLAMSHPEAAAIANSVMESKFPEAIAREVAVVAAERAWRSGRTDLAWQHIRKAVDSVSLDEAPAAAVGWWVLLQQGSRAVGDDERQAEIDQKIDHLRSRAAAAGERGSPEASFWLAIIEGNRALDTGNLRLAAERLEHAVSFEQRSGLAEFLLGHADRRTGEWRRAAARWEMLLRQNPNWRALRSAHVSLLIENGEYEDAVNRAQAALAWSPERPEALQFSRAIMALAESRQADPARTTQLLTILESIVQQATADGAIQTCAARAFVAAGRSEDAERAVQRILDPAASPPPAELILPLALAFREHSDSDAAKLLELAQMSAASPDALYARALALAEQGKHQEARALLEERIEGTLSRERLAFQLRLARLLGQIGDSGAAVYLAALASEHDRNPEIQIVLLEADSVWEDEAVVAAAIQRLREAAGAESSAWRIHEARRLLRFTPSHPRAAQAIQVLAPILRQGATGGDGFGPHPMALALAGEAYLVLDDRERAIDHLTRAVDAEPARARYYPRLIELLQAAGRSEQAGRRLTAFARVEPIQPDVRRLRAQLALSQGSWDVAFADFTALAEAPGASLEDRFGLALVHLRRGHPDRAVAILEELAKRPQATPAMLVAAADLRAGTKKSQSDIDAGRLILEEAPAELPPQLRGALVAAYLQRHGQPGDAEALLLKAASQDNGIDADAVAELARFYLDADRLEEAGEALARGIAMHPEHLILRRLQALLRIQRGENTSDAWAELSESLNAWLDAPPGLRELASAMQHRAADPGDTAGHIARLEQLTRLHPTFYTGWQILVQSLAEKGELRRASDAALAAARAMPADPRPAQLAANSLVQQRRYDEALAAATQWRSRAAHDAFDADLFIAWIMQQLGRPQEGLRVLDPWRQRLSADPDPDRMLLNAGLLIDVGRMVEASALVWPLAEQDRAWALRYIALAARIREAEAARGWLTRVQAIFSSDVQGRLALGEAWFQLLSRTKAPADLQRTISLLDELTTDEVVGFSAHSVLAGACEVAGEIGEAERHYRAALDLKPDDMVVLNNLAYLLAQGPSESTSTHSAERAARVAEAVDLAARAVAAAHGQGMPPSVVRAILDTHGVALLSAERWSEAEATFREALQLDPSAPDLLIGLAEARFGQGHAEEALSLIQTARSRTTPAAPLAPTRAARLKALESRIGR